MARALPKPLFIYARSNFHSNSCCSARLVSRLFFFLFENARIHEVLRSILVFFLCLCVYALHEQSTLNSRDTVTIKCRHISRTLTACTTRRGAHRNHNKHDYKERAKGIMAYHAHYTRAVCVYLKCMSYVCLKNAINASGSNRERRWPFAYCEYTHT